MSRLNRPFGQIFQDVAHNTNSTVTNLETNAQIAENPNVSSIGSAGTHSAQPGFSRLLNIGCGYDKRPGYLNIDMDPMCKPDFLVTADNADNLPSNYFEKVLAKDVLEHIPRTQTLAALLQWAQYLKLGSRLELQTSSVYGIVDMMRQQETFEYHYGMTVCMFGSQAHPGDFHYTGFTEQTLKVHLLAAGFMPISIKLEEGWLFHVQAIKYEDWSVEPDADDKIAALSWGALGREPDDHYYKMLANNSYVAIPRALYSSPERLYFVASKFGI